MPTRSSGGHWTSMASGWLALAALAGGVTAYLVALPC
jgi:hypothetical protein